MPCTAERGSGIAPAPRACYGAGVRLLLVLVPLVVACGRPQHEYAAEVVDNFLHACRSRGGSEAACRCALDRIRERYTEDEYRDVERRVAAHDEATVRALADLTAGCRGR
jgi:hypothetical protein